MCWIRASCSRLSRLSRLSRRDRVCHCHCHRHCTLVATTGIRELCAVAERYQLGLSGTRAVDVATRRPRYHERADGVTACGRWGVAGTPAKCGETPYRYKKQADKVSLVSNTVMHGIAPHHITLCIVRTTSFLLNYGLPDSAE